MRFSGSRSQFLPLTREYGRGRDSRLLTIWTLAPVLNSQEPQTNASASSWVSLPGQPAAPMVLASFVQDRERHLVQALQGPASERDVQVRAVTSGVGESQLELRGQLIMPAPALDGSQRFGCGKSAGFCMSSRWILTLAGATG